MLDGAFLGAGAGFSGTNLSRGAGGEFGVEPLGSVGARIRIDRGGRVGVGLRIGFVAATGLVAFVTGLLLEGSSDRCFASNSSTSLAAGAMDVSSFGGRSMMLELRVRGC